MSINGVEHVIGKEDVEILHEDIQGWMVESDGTMTVALDTELDEDLINEGLAREFVNRLQNMRKDAGLEVTDRIKIYYRATDRLTRALVKLAGYVKQETLATAMSSETPSTLNLTEADINGETASIGIEKSIDS